MMIGKCFRNSVEFFFRFFFLKYIYFLIMLFKDFIKLHFFIFENKIHRALMYWL